MGFFDWLSGADMKTNKNCTLQGYSDDNRYGKWVYTCKVKCPKSDATQVVRCFTEDIKTQPSYRCSCGEVISLFSAPYKTYFGNDKSKFHYSGSLLRMSTGKWGRHQVTLGEVIECEQDW